MASVSKELIDLLLDTANRIELSTEYQWGHMGSCNCGFLAQQITGFDKKEIHQQAMYRSGDWSEQLKDYCPGSGIAMDEIIERLTAAGFSIQDLINLERLEDSRVLRMLPSSKRQLKHNRKEDVVSYFRAWAEMLTLELIQYEDILPLTHRALVKA